MSAEKRLAVVALGGNALLNKETGSDIHSQFKATRESMQGVADAMTCGSIGYMIEQSLQNRMIRSGIWRNVVTIPAQILEDPTKPIGPFYTEEEAIRHLIDEEYLVITGKLHGTQDRGGHRVRPGQSGEPGNYNRREESPGGGSGRGR